MPGQCTRSRAEGDGRSAANQCCDMKADLGTIGPEATLKARRCVGPTLRKNDPRAVPCAKSRRSALIALKKVTASSLVPASLKMRSQDTTGKEREGVCPSLAWIENIA